MNPIDKMVWVDLETTGLDPVRDSILEIAVIVTQGTNFDIVYESESVLPLPKRNITEFSPEVLEIHGRSGLLSESANVSGVFHAGKVEHDLLHAIRRFTTYASCIGPICGSSPHFDKRFLDVHMRNFAALFSYRTFDVSTLRQAFCNLIQANGEAPAVDPDNTQHRALPDLRWSIQKARDITKLLRDGMYR